jgi:isopenicillin-N N-acyltransferase like protein
MIPVHVSVEDTGRERGLGFGTVHRAAVQGTVSAYGRLLRTVHRMSREDLGVAGRRVREELTGTMPDLLAEIDAIAEGAGVPADDLVAINARTELLAGGARPECSVIGVSAARSELSGPLLAQNWDWHPDLGPSLVLWTVKDRGGAWFTTLTEAGVLAKIGMNSRGLAICLNLLVSSLERGDAGVPIHLLIRRLLERSGDLASATAAVRGSCYSASTAISVASSRDPFDDLRTFELSPAGVSMLEPEDGVLLHTNHFRALPAGSEDRYRRDWPDTVRRLDELQYRFAELAPDLPVSVDFIKRRLASHEGGDIAICCHDRSNPSYADRQETLASVLIVPGEQRMWVAPGSPCTHSYAPVPLPALVE